LLILPWSYFHFFLWFANIHTLPCFKGFITYSYIMILSSILIMTHKYIVKFVRVTSWPSTLSS
jgi:hypothetical protein